MTTSKSTQATNSRLKIGAAVLTAAQVVNTKSVTARLNAFTEAHQSYTDAQRKLEEAEARLSAEKVKLEQLQAEHDLAVETLACRLIGDGQPRANPFASFGAPVPSTIKAMNPDDATGAVHALVAAVQRDKSLSPVTMEAAKGAEETAQRIDALLAPIATLNDELRAARRVRDVVARSWDRTLAALRREARAAADEGAPGLYAALFGNLRRVPKKTKAAPQQPPATGETPVTPAPSAE